MRIFIDMDGTIAKFHPEKSLEEVASAGYFKRVEPISQVINGIKALFTLPEIEIYVLSSVFNDDHSISDKNEWLDTYFPVPRDHRLFVPYGTSKSQWLKEIMGINPKDVLVDDFTKNLRQWHGIGVKILNGINHTHASWRGYVLDGRMEAPYIAKTLLGIIRLEDAA